MSTRPTDERILILARQDRDATLTKALLEARGMTCEVCPSLQDFSRRITEGSGVGLVDEESLNSEGLAEVARILSLQAPWSDFPMIAIASRGQSADLSARRYNQMRKLGNLTIIERPFHATTLLSAVISGLRTRRHQYETRAYFLDRRRNEDMIASLNQGLEQKVLERTRELATSQDALGQAQRLEAIGRLAGGVAHDFNNLLTGILGMVDEVATDLGTADAHYQDLQEVLSAARRGAQLTKQLLAFGRPQDAVLTVLNVNDVIHDMNKMFVRFLTENVALSLRLDSHLDSVSMDKSQLEQVLLNLVLNARDAMPKGGNISITSSNVTVAAHSVRGAFGIPAGAYVLITVSDTGAGMSLDTMKHLFEPFYTTKEVGTGTGLGLATVYGILKQSAGDICVESGMGSGSTFKIYLPKAQKEATAPSEPRPDELSSIAGETILVVEDENIVRRVVVKTLEKKGYKVLEVARGHLALQLCRGYRERIDMLLTDVMMPGMNGRQLAESPECKERRMAVLFMSGHTYDVITRNELLKPGFAFIEKTFTADALCRKVREVLDAHNFIASSHG